MTEHELTPFSLCSKVVFSGILDLCLGPLFCVFFFWTMRGIDYERFQLSSSKISMGKTVEEHGDQIAEHHPHYRASDSAAATVVEGTTQHVHGHGHGHAHSGSMGTTGGGGAPGAHLSSAPTYRTATRHSGGDQTLHEQHGMTEKQAEAAAAATAVPGHAAPQSAQYGQQTVGHPGQTAQHGHMTESYNQQQQQQQPPGAMPPSVPFTATPTMPSTMP